MTVRDPEVLLKVWAEHFQTLGESRLGATTDACQWKRKVESLESQSHSNEEFLLDVPFTAEEVSGAVARLKGKKAPVARWSNGRAPEIWRSGGCHLADEDPQRGNRARSYP